MGAGWREASEGRAEAGEFRTLMGRGAWHRATLALIRTSSFILSEMGANGEIWSEERLVVTYILKGYF